MDYNFKINGCVSRPMQRRGFTPLKFFVLLTVSNMFTNWLRETTTKLRDLLTVRVAGHAARFDYVR
jgi:hypothetical protein